MFGRRDDEPESAWAPAPEPQRLEVTEEPSAPPTDGPEIVQREPRFSWWRIAVAASAVVAALSLAVIASMQRDTRDVQRQQICLYIAQLQSFQGSADGDDAEEAYQQSLEECGIELEDEE